MAKLRPQWQRELMNFKGIKSLFVLEKNVDDVYPWWDGAVDDPGVSDCRFPFPDLREVVKAVFSGDGGGASYQLLYYDPLRHFSNPDNNPALRAYLAAADRAAAERSLESHELNAFGRQGGRQDGAAACGDAAGLPAPKAVYDSMVIRSLLSDNLAATAQAGEGQVGVDGGKPVAVVVDMASRLVSSPTSLDPDEIAFFSNLLIAANEAKRPDKKNVNTLILIANNTRDLPEWFISGNPNLRSIVVPSPDREAREMYVGKISSLGSRPVAESDKACYDQFIDKTDGMTLRELDELRRMHARDGLPASELPGLVDLYKYGIRENKWASIFEKLENDPAGIIRRRVKGQDQAIDAVVSVLKRSSLGLSGATHSSSAKPKGILFLSGPTGTGKTEIVKAVTELLFGDERSMLRFDMSEYQGDNSDQKLFGAPPGYVGYSQGGQLTNAVRANPFSVLLFDEIEKASPSIMDKFLQILEDGRMTDGQGNTVYFSETIIFFTSNIGFSREVYDGSGHVIDHVAEIEPGTPYGQIRAKVMDAMRANFKPEFLGRIGNNVVVFDFIDDDSARAIANQKIDQINATVLEQHRVSVDVSAACRDYLVGLCLAGAVKEKGGRGIGNCIESAYLNVLSDFLFDARCQPGDAVAADVLPSGDGIGFAKGARDEG